MPVRDVTVCPWHRCMVASGVNRARGRWFRRPETDEENERSERIELEQLAERARRSEEEVAALRRRLSEGPGRVQTLEERLLETKGQLSQAVSQNEKLTFTLQQAKEHIAALREEVDKLTQPPCAYGTFLAANEDDRHRGRVLRWPQDARGGPPRDRRRGDASR